MIGRVVFLAVALAVMAFAAADFAAAWRDRPRPVRGSDGVWRAARRYHNGWGERR